jgi:hypothetical protein
MLKRFKIHYQIDFGGQVAYAVARIYGADPAEAKAKIFNTHYVAALDHQEGLPCLFECLPGDVSYRILSCVEISFGT